MCVYVWESSFYFPGFRQYVAIHIPKYLQNDIFGIYDQPLKVMFNNVVNIGYESCRLFQRIYSKYVFCVARN